MNPTLPLTSFLISSSDPGYVSSADKERVIYNSVPRLIFKKKKSEARKRYKTQARGGLRMKYHFYVVRAAVRFN